ncbi:F-box/LRR-repeat protein 5 [Triplophysa rosa]|uniref:F-box/LRR-repeat protein 5 n=1 Tax=Triplophysa rosa TaxID=992332 RepID=A0A9W7WDL2_TRIRA|nr:F-box/LRR-repeat protein 5 [Triplophysa rosa]KAI7793953.1 putative F-box/LRR-repeat protein 5-like [Triplophysa rosa]
MALFPDEVDVFTGPHWRMKQLVGLYSEKLSKTNFSNIRDFRSFLQSLLATFKEFKMHEQIENECIMDLLQQRSQTVYHVHADNKLSEMLTLFEKGLRSVKSEYEQLNYARQLKERLEAFTQDFLPHMKEEEEVYQPMLMEYFSYEELKAIKRQVMLQHSSTQSWSSAADVLKGLNLWTQAEELHKAFKYSDHEKTEDERDGEGVSIFALPQEVVLRVFRYLGPEDLCRCGQVCSTWAQVVKTGSLWRHLYPVRWARSDYYCGPPGDLDQEPDEDLVKSLQDEGRAYQEWDEDADVDESEEASEGCPAISAVQREKTLLNGMIQNLLPTVGPSVRSLSLAYSSAVSSKMVRQILSFCPNLTHLDLTQTDVSDSAFDSWAEFGACRSLEHLDLSGCDKITDRTLKILSFGLGDLTAHANSSRSKLLKAPPSPIKLQEEHSLPPMGRSCQELIFKRRPGGRGSGCGPVHVWVLDPAELADIEDTADWSRRGGVVSQESGRGSVLELQGGGGSCCCRRSQRRSFRTGFSSSHWQYSSVGDARCGHSTCCTSDMALWTVREQCDTPATGGAVDFRTKCSFEGDSCPKRHKRTDQSGACRALGFLSLSGCCQITDLGLRCLSQRGGLPQLEHLNLSGCLLITGAGLHELVSVCPALNMEHFYYCDNINGPHADTASGCQNLQCGFRACCRSGE